MTDISENRGIIAGGDVKDANLINVGNIEGSYNAIGVGAQVIIQQVQDISPVEKRREAMRESQVLLADAIEAKVGDYMKLLDKNRADSRRNPYKSLRSYRLEDAPYFYGREDAITEMLDQIHQEPLTILYAASGAGKSSLLQAGLMSRLLAAGHLPLYIRTRMQAGSRVDRLDLATLIKTEFLPDVAIESGLEVLNNMSLLNFLTEVSRNLGKSTLYIFLDQFEDFFNDIVVHPTLREPFIRDLNACLYTAGLDVRWVLSLRKEYVLDLDPFGHSLVRNRVLLSGLNMEEAQQVITEPAQKCNVIYEQGLVPQILSDLSVQEQKSQAETIQAPGLIPSIDFAPTHIQLVCYTLFNELEQGATKINHALYNQPRGQSRLPGAEGILTGHLRSVLDRNLLKEEGKLADSILIELVTSQNKRIPRKLNELMELLQRRDVSCDETKIRRILEVLVDNRLLETDDESDTYELTHDYLVNEIEMDQANRNRKAAQELLDQEVIAYEQFDTLLDEQKFDIIQEQRNFLVLSVLATELLDQSQEELERIRRREIRRLRQRVLLTTALFVLVSIIAGILAIEPIQRAYWKYSATNAVPIIDVPELGIQFEAYEVTNERYAWCVQAQACSETDIFRQEYNNDDWEAVKTQVVRGATANQAIEFCEWIDRTLPTAEQWVTVAPPLKKWRELEPDTALFCRDSDTCEDPSPPIAGGRTRPQYPEEPQASEGIFDLVGSVIEWTRTSTVLDQNSEKWCQNVDTIENENTFIALGDAYDDTLVEIGNYGDTGGSSFWRTSMSEDVGFRCVSQNRITSQHEKCPQFR